MEEGRSSEDPQHPHSVRMPVHTGGDAGWSAHSTETQHGGSRKVKEQFCHSEGPSASARWQPGVSQGSSAYAGQWIQSS